MVKLDGRNLLDLIDLTLQFVLAEILPDLPQVNTPCPSVVVSLNNLGTYYEMLIVETLANFLCFHVIKQITNL